MPPSQSYKRKCVACQHSPDDQTLLLQAGAGEDDVIYLQSGLGRTDCEPQEEVYTRVQESFWVVGFKVFLSEGLSLGAALGVVLTNTRDGTPIDGRSSLTPGRNGKTWEGRGGGGGGSQGCPVVAQEFCSGE